MWQQSGNNSALDSVSRPEFGKQRLDVGTEFLVVPGRDPCRMALAKHVGRGRDQMLIQDLADLPPRLPGREALQNDLIAFCVIGPRPGFPGRWRRLQSSTGELLNQGLDLLEAVVTRRRCQVYEFVPLIGG